MKKEYYRRVDINQIEWWKYNWGNKLPECILSKI